MPVHRWIGLLSFPALPLMRNSLAAGPYIRTSRLGLPTASGPTACSPPFSFCFHSSLKKSGGRSRAGPPARPCGAAAPGAAGCCANDTPAVSTATAAKSEEGMMRPM